jgi:uncharacterized protein (DUF1778 family)
MPSRALRDQKLDLDIQQTFALDARRWKTFPAALDAPPRRLPRLKRLLKEPGFFDAKPLL